MPKSHNEHPHHNHDHKHQPSNHSSKKGIHRDWRFWVAVILMLAAMGAYVTSDDESLQPGGGEGPPVPAAE